MLWSPKARCVLCPQFAGAGGESSCFPLIRAERQEAAGTSATNLVREAGRGVQLSVRLVPWLVQHHDSGQKGKAPCQQGTLHTLGQILHGALPSKTQVFGCKSRAAPGAQGWRRLTLSYSWMLLVRGGWVLCAPFPLPAKNLPLPQNPTEPWMLPSQGWETAKSSSVPALPGPGRVRSASGFHDGETGFYQPAQTLAAFGHRRGKSCENGN